jgi:hypothetical protein
MVVLVKRICRIGARVYLRTRIPTYVCAYVRTMYIRICDCYIRSLMYMCIYRHI